MEDYFYVSVEIIFHIACKCSGKLVNTFNALQG